MTRKTLPNATGALVLGILSIVFSCVAFLGLAMGIIGLVLANGALRTYNENPDEYESAGSAKGGKVCSIIGIVLGGISLILGIIVTLGGQSMTPFFYTIF